MNWLKDKTVGKIKRWFNRQFLRVIGELHKERFREREKDIPEELKEYHRIEALMNVNATALHNLYREAKDANKFQEAFLYFFYELEITLKHMIMSEMMTINNLANLKNDGENFFPTHSLERVIGIQKIGKISKLIDIFCSIHGNEVKVDLRGINDARNFIIHNMLKEEMSEAQIKKSFEYFFTATNGQINKVFGFLLKIIKERPKKLLASMEQLKARK